MKMKITVFDGKNDCFVKNCSDIPFITDELKVDVGEEVTAPISLVKIRMGDWEDESFAERKRRERLGITRLELEIIKKKAPKEKETVKFTDYVENVSEPEFTDLNEEEEDVPLPTIPQCKAITKSGKQCQRISEVGKFYCTTHKKHS
jgi:hypothetical protein